MAEKVAFNHPVATPKREKDVVKAGCVQPQQLVLFFPFDD